MTRLTPTQQAFWLTIFDHAQVVTCASERKAGLRKLWWKMKVIEVPALPLDVAKEIVREYITQRGMMIESPELYVGHVVKQAGGNPQAIHDMVDESSKERLVDKRQIREMRHQAGVRYVDFTPAMIVVGAMVVATRYVALGIGDRSLYVMAGIGAALFLSIRFFMFKGAGKANRSSPAPTSHLPPRSTWAAPRCSSTRPVSSAGPWPQHICHQVLNQTYPRNLPLYYKSSRLLFHHSPGATL